MSNENPGVVTCSHVEYRDDMYPEFAPGQIVIRCEDEAETWIALVDDHDDTYREVLCNLHTLSMVQQCLESGFPFTLSTLDAQDRAQYVAGTLHAMTQQVADKQWFAAGYEGWGELHTPEQGHPMFDIGWENTMAERLAKWQENPANNM